MSNRKVLLTESSLEDIADAIREKTGGSDTYTPAAMAAGIRSIEGGVTPSESLAGNLAVAYRDLAYPVAAGTHCVYGGNYYIAAVEIEYAETFNADHWTRVTAGEEIEDLAAAVGDLDAALDGKQPIEPGMGLSTNDYTDADKAALEAMAAALSGAQVRRRYAGASISAGDTVAEEIAMFTLYGKCVQSGTPTPNNPVAIGIAGSGDSIGIVNNGDTVTLPIPGGLPGVPVSSGGNYIDANGQRWICDTIDKATGTYTRRLATAVLDGSENWRKGASIFLNAEGFYDVFPDTYPSAPGLSNMVVINTRGVTDNNTARFAANGYQFLCYTDAVSTVDEWKALLSQTPMVVIYALAVPVVTDLSAAQLAALDALRAADGTTTLATTDAVQPEMAAAVFVQLPEYTA